MVKLGEEMSGQTETEQWWDFLGVKVPKTLTKMMERYISRDTHATKSELVRSAIREKIQRDMPELWNESMKEYAKEEEKLRREKE